MMTRQSFVFDTQSTLFRTGFLATAIVLLNTSFDYGQRSFALLYSFDVLWSLLLAILGVAFLVIGLLPAPRYRFTIAILFGLMLVACTKAQIQAANYSPLLTPRTDNEMIAEYSVEALRQGENPYLWNYTDMMRVFRDSGRYITYFLDGSVQNRVTYPIFPTLMLYAFDMLGIDQIRTVLLLYLLALLVLMFFGSPSRYRPVILLPLFIVGDFIDMGFRGAQDIVWTVMLIGVILTWRRTWLCAFLFGIAVMYRQQPWFIAPFLLIVMWNEHGTMRQRLLRMGQFVLISVGLFVLVNIPYFVDDPQAWLLGALEPSYARFNVLSQGLGALTQYGLLSLPREFYTVTQLCFLLVALIAHWRHPRAVGGAFWIFPAIFFWLYYRGLGNYWFYWMPVLVFALVRPLPQANLSSSARPFNTFKLAAPLILMPLVLLVYFLSQSAGITLRVLAPLYLARGNIIAVNQMVVRVSNNSHSTITPRFAVQFDLPTQGFVWRIVAGPHFLRPGVSGDYLITADYNAGKMLLPNRNAQMIVTDAGGDYRLSALDTIRFPDDYPTVGHLRNAGYRYWLEGFAQPEGWVVDAPTSTGIMLEMVEIKDRIALLLDSSETSVRGTFTLTQSVEWMDNFDLWVYPPRLLSDPNVQPYGLLIEDGVHQLRLLFASRLTQTEIQEDGLSATLIITSLERQWTLKTINLTAIYDSLGWSAPEFQLDAETGTLHRPMDITILLSLNGEQVIAPEVVPIDQPNLLDQQIDALVENQRSSIGAASP